MPENAELSGVPRELLAPGVLPELWPASGPLTVGAVKEFFAGGKVVQVRKSGFDEPMSIPKAAPEAVLDGVRAAIQTGMLWLVAGQASIWKESIPAGVLNDAAQLLGPPNPIPVTEILKETLPDAWEQDATTAIAILNACSTKAGSPQPWPLVSDAIDSALRGHYLERTEDSGPWPCELAAASSVKLRVVSATVITREDEVVSTPKKPGVRRASAKLTTDQLQDLSDKIGEIKKVATGAGLDIEVIIEIGNEAVPSEEALRRMSDLLQGIYEGFKID